MGLDEVAEEILSAGRESAEEVLRQARAEAERLVAEAQEKAVAVREEKTEQAERRARQMRVQELASAELEGKRARLVMEKDVLAAASERARAMLGALPAEQDQRMLGSILKKHSSPGFRVFGAPRNESFLRSQPGVEFAGTVKCLGGILFESQDGTVRMDFTYDTLLGDIVERNMKEVARILFSG
jgi:V/A-type H+-transporting ATPase subunit E